MRTYLAKQLLRLAVYLYKTKRQGKEPSGADTVAVAISLQELRIMCMWAENWARRLEAQNNYPSGPSVVYAIADKLRTQIGRYNGKAVCLTLADEFKVIEEAGYKFSTDNPSADE